MVPRSTDGAFRVRDVSQWLWQRFVADGWKNYGALEKAHLHALLATGHDLGYYLHDTLPGEPNPTIIYYGESFADTSSPASLAVLAAGDMDLALDSSDPDTRSNANRRIQRAIAFIAATPYTFIEEGR